MIKCVSMVGLHQKNISHEGLKSGATNSNAPRGQRGHQNERRETGGNCGQWENICAIQSKQSPHSPRPFCHTGR